MIPVLRLPTTLAGVVALSSFAMAEPIAIPEKRFDFIDTYCIDCHDSASKKGEVDLEFETIDWNSPKNQKLWEKVHQVVEEGMMPPAKKKQPSAYDRKAMVKWIDESLAKHVEIGTTGPRRLSAAEYEKTVRSVFEMPDFKLPMGFPSDPKVHGFSNLAEGLSFSPTLMESYRQVAAQMADHLYPAARSKPEVKTLTAGPNDFALSFSASGVFGDALRLASRGNDSVMRSCTWPSRIEIARSGIYRVTVSASQFKPKDDQPMTLEVRAREVAASDRTHVPVFRLLKTFPVTSEDSQTVTFEAELYEGQTLMFRWTNAELSHNPKEVAALMKGWFERDARMLAAWQKTLYPGMTLKSSKGYTHLRGMNGWKIIKKHYADPKLDLSQAKMDSPLTKAILKMLATIGGGRFTMADALCHYYHENGPAMELHKASVEGPLRLVDSPEDKKRYALRKRLFGNAEEEASPEYLQSALARFLPRAFRGPVDQTTVEQLAGIAIQHWKEGHSFDEGMHLVLRNVLVSPRFLFRAIGTPETKQHQLAARLSYFLRQAPPDGTLLKLASEGKLSDPAVLRREALRLIPTSFKDAMVKDFTGQWLDTNRLVEIMPDPKFKFGERELGSARVEIEVYFADMLKDNLPISDFINPDFIYTSPSFAKKVYGLNLKGDHSKITRRPVPRGGRLGGLLSQSAIMLTTANGVDTQPVLRGVWVLENIIGTPTPEAPEDVPALTPDVRGATTPRELLAAHTKEQSCLACHQRIDPIGFVLENYDPIGRWREYWPKGGKIDSSGVLPDGTKVKDVVDLKLWLADNIELFGQCLSEKLLTYATGRVLNYRERKEIEGIVRRNISEKQGFRDLVLDLIESQTFQSL